jgi:hypothetical protein
MINLSQQICEELDLTYWQLRGENSIQKHSISRDEKELLRKILLAKSITLSESLLEIHSNEIVIVNLSKQRLVFNNVKLTDTDICINLPKLSEMLHNSHYKKEAWFKLKDRLLE